MYVLLHRQKQADKKFDEEKYIYFLLLLRQKMLFSNFSPWNTSTLNTESEHEEQRNIKHPSK